MEEITSKELLIGRILKLFIPRDTIMALMKKTLFFG